MADSSRTPRVALLAPMRSELRPLLEALPLVRAQHGDLSVHSGKLGDVEVVAALTGMGTQAATRATERVLRAMPVDHVVVVGIAGGVGASVAIGDLVVPEAVVDGPSGREYRQAPLGDAPPRGKIVTSDQFGYDPDTIARFIQQGVVALDMETASVAAVCEAQGCPWSTFRAISDRGDDDTVDPAVLGLAGPDGAPNVPALLRYLLRRPWRIVRLAKLGRDSKVAAERAAAAAIRAVAQAHWRVRRHP